VCVCLSGRERCQAHSSHTHTHNTPFLTHSPWAPLHVASRNCILASMRRVAGARSGNRGTSVTRSYYVYSMRGVCVCVCVCNVASLSVCVCVWSDGFVSCGLIPQRRVMFPPTSLSPSSRLSAMHFPRQTVWASKRTLAVSGDSKAVVLSVRLIVWCGAGWME
jgi:hypothetical protein